MGWGDRDGGLLTGEQKIRYEGGSVSEVRSADRYAHLVVEADLHSRKEMVHATA